MEDEIRKKKRKKKTQKYAYIRVSTKEQNEDRQVNAIAALNIPKKNVFLDKMSGKDFERPSYQKMLTMLKEDDVLYLPSIDRLGRNYEEVMEQWRIITKEKKADIVVLDMDLLDTRHGKDLLGTFIADLVLQVLSFTAQKERENIRQRQAEGIAAAKDRGVVFGRPALEIPEGLEFYMMLWRQKELTLQQIGDIYGISRSSAYKLIRRLESRE